MGEKATVKLGRQDQATAQTFQPEGVEGNHTHNLTPFGAAVTGVALVAFDALVSACSPQIAPVEAEQPTEVPIKPGIYGVRKDSGAIPAEIQQALLDSGESEFPQLIGVSGVTEDANQTPSAFFLGKVESGNTYAVFQKPDGGYLIKPVRRYVWTDDVGQVHYSYSVYDKSGDTLTRRDFLDFQLNLNQNELVGLSPEEIDQLIAAETGNPENIARVRVDNPYDTNTDGALLDSKTPGLWESVRQFVTDGTVRTALAAEDDQVDFSEEVKGQMAPPVEEEVVTPAPTVEATPAPTPTPSEADIKAQADLIKAEFVKSPEYTKVVNNYLNALGLVESSVLFSDETVNIMGQEYRFLFANPDKLKLTEEQQKYIKLYEKYPLFMFRVNKDNEVQIIEFTPSTLATQTGIFVGTIGRPPEDKSEGVPMAHALRDGTYDSIFTITNVWASREKEEGRYKWGYNDDQLDQAFKYHTGRIRMAHILANPAPKWLANKPSAEFRADCDEQIEMVMTTFYEKVAQKYRSGSYKGPFVLEFNVVNEPWKSQPYAQKYGSQGEYVLNAMQKAIEVREKIMSERKDGDPEIQIELGFSNADNHFPQGVGYSQTIDVLQYLEANGVHIDYVDLHAHEKDFNTAPEISEILKVVGEISKFTRPDGSPMKIVIGEYDLNIRGLKGTDRLLKQGTRYFEFFEALLDAGVSEFTIWEIYDALAWYETGESEAQYQSEDADALVYDEQGNPKPSHIGVVLAIWQRYLELKATP